MSLLDDALSLYRSLFRPSAVLDRPPWNALRAVREHRVYVLADADILERPGPRFVDGLAWLIDRLHPAQR